MTGAGVHTLLESLKILGVAVLPLTAYLAWMRVGTKVGAFVSWGSDLMTAPGIRTVTLINLKDRALVVFSLYGEAGGKVLQLKAFSPPLVLKGLEALRVDIEAASGYRFEGKPFTISPPVLENKMTIYVETTSKVVKCVDRFPGSFRELVSKRNFGEIFVERRRFNGRIYNERVRYAVVYHDDDKQRQTAFIDDSGFIDWGIPPNRLLPGHLANEESVRAALDRDGVGERVQPYGIMRIPPE